MGAKSQDLPAHLLPKLILTKSSAHTSIPIPISITTNGADNTLGVHSSSHLRISKPSNKY